jgi:hypothetical protein
VRAAVPEGHRNQETKDAVKVGMGFVSTMAALVLGLLVASTKGAYDTKKSEVTQMAAKVVFLDRALATYGSEAAETRELLSRSVASVVDRMWPGKSSQTTQLDPSASSAEALFHSIQKLSPQNDAQRSLKSQALQVAVDLGQTRWLLFEQTETSISLPMLIILLCIGPKSYIRNRDRAIALRSWIAIKPPSPYEPKIPHAMDRDFVRGLLPNRLVIRRTESRTSSCTRSSRYFWRGHQPRTSRPAEKYAGQIIRFASEPRGPSPPRAARGISLARVVAQHRLD